MTRRLTGSAVGSSEPRIDALGKVTGATLYPGDLNRPDQLYMKILFAHRPHAIVKAIDTAAALALDGVVGVFTAADLPVNEYGLTMRDQPVLCGPGAAKPHTDRVRFVGDQVAVIVAESEAIAAKARDLIIVEYEELPVLSDPEAAMAADADLLHPDHGSNVIQHYEIRKGDVDAGFAAADVIVEGEYRTPAQEHAYLAPEAGMAYWDEDERITIAVAGQWAHEEQEMIAHALGLPIGTIRVIHPAIGGAFGGREDISIQLALALALWRLGERGIHRPIKIVWTREESIIGHHKRHPYLIRAKWGAKRDGTIIAAKAEVIADGGAYNYTSNKVLGNATLMVSGPYAIENVWVDAAAVYTNNVPGGAFRGFGGPQGAFAAELQLAKLAEALDIDPVELRLKNMLRTGQVMHTQTTMPGEVTLDRVVAHAARVSGWAETDGSWRRAKTNGRHTDATVRGTGFACGFKNVGFSFGFPERAWATIELHGTAQIERVIVRQAGSDVGQGAHTVFRQMTADAVGVPLEQVELIAADTAETGDAGSSSASRMTFMAGNAIRGAAEQALAQWQDEERPAIATYKYTPPPTTAFEPGTGIADPNFMYGYVAESVELEVDTETGLVHLHKVVCADDVGKAINPQQVEGQIEGCVVQAAGYAILENFIQQGGYVQTAMLSNYLIPTVLDVPDVVQSEILEYASELGPFGARGMAEMPFIPLAAAVMDAFHDATGVWVNEFPLTPERVLRALGKL